MPAGQGESHLTTVFADVHYYFNDPSSRPQHHRFDRASYLYLFHNPLQQQAKIEIANHAGTPEQDAFAGYLNNARIRYSHKQPTLFTFSLDPSSMSDASQWHLPTYNERNEAKYMYKLHTLDVYLWTEKDAATFLNHLRSIIAPARLDVRDAPKSQSSYPEHRDSMSPVVQQLERTAIGNNFPPRAGSTVSTQSFPGPPTSAVSGTPAPPAAAPMAYNPAAPAAPEPIAHREKTPPPPDDGTGTGLKAAAKYDDVQQAPHATNQNPYFGQGPQQAPYFAGPPQLQQQQQQRHGSTSSIPSQHTSPPPMFPGGFGSPAPHHQQQQQLKSTPSFGPFAQSTISTASPPPSNLPQQFQRQQSFGAPPPAYAASQSPAQVGPSFAPPPSQFPAQSSEQPHQQAPIGGYSSYSYAGGPATPDPSSSTPGAGVGGSGDLANRPGGYVGDMHAQLYRPTAEEAAHAHASHGHAKVPSRKKTGPGTGQPGEDKEKPKLEDSFQRLEGKVGRYLNKLDKLW